jgi:iron(III) transport system permease protein
MDRGESGSSRAEVQCLDSVILEEEKKIRPYLEQDEGNGQNGEGRLMTAHTGQPTLQPTRQVKPSVGERLVGALNPATVVMGLAGIALMILVAYPMYSLLSRSVMVGGSLSLGNFKAVFGARENYIALQRSLFVSCMATLFATTLGAFLAWIVCRTDVPGRKTLKTALVMPVLVPPFISAIAWLQLIGPAGYINSIYMAIKDSWDPLFVIYGPWAIILVMTISGYPLAYLVVLGGLERMNPELEEAAQISGAGAFTVMRDVTFPLMAPTIGAAALLVFVSKLENFGVPAVMGMPKNYYVLTTKIYRLITQSFTVPNALSIATAMSVLFVIIATAALLVVRTYLQRGRYIVISGKNVHPKVMRLGKLGKTLSVFCWTIVITTVVLPLIAIVLTSLTRAYGLPPLPGNWTLRNYRYVLFGLSTTQRAFRNSFILAVMTSTLTLSLGAIIAYISVKTKTRFRSVLDVVASIPYSIPGTVFALGMILAWNKVILGRFSLYNTFGIILVAYCARYLAYGVRTVSSSLAQIDDSLEEAARISGASWLSTLRDIVVPLIKPGLVAGFFLIFLPSLRELTISVLLWSPGNETLGVAVYNLHEAGNITASSALAVVMVAIMFVGNWAVKRITKGQVGY